MAMVRSEEGIGTILALCMSGVLLAVGWVVAGVVAMAATQHRAAAAADLSALAGAGAHRQGHSACEAAAEVALANDARLLSCDDDAGVVRVEVVAESVKLLGRRWESVRTARAGPVGAGP
jgi:secretion/DNA translocation related TadE-like protein